MAAPLDLDILAGLRAIGIHEPSPEEPLHVRLVSALYRTRGESWGNALIAIKFEFNWACNQAGEVYANAKTDYERLIDIETTKIRATQEKVSRAEAEQIVRATEEAYKLKLAFLVAEKREQSMRKFLDTLGEALELHRTDRADKRKTDSFHAEAGV
ncbi:hypothetical protein [Lysinibacter cavernae]|uniref:Uncharacterized protein n=1 Tax=Lysinibacter cavernae TaxID=1640652 RepID=A0A7X5TRQ7_9MICO|nr:hypothetical protein [Lysinibacter cavernae]NIH52521.1 hypothetical protein [Lysinibacter cavernae]